ncbi:MAG: hypothetical protein FWF88_07350, partial [Peptococcaceae bacterium]|nr:hypothetical protein [Peptococcaceae bacterium]
GWGAADSKSPRIFFAFRGLRRAVSRLESAAPQPLTRPSLNRMHVPHEYPRIAGFWSNETGDRSTDIT